MAAPATEPGYPPSGGWAKEVSTHAVVRPPRKGRPKAVINPDSCTGCEVCVAVCPVDCIDKTPGPEYAGLNAVCVIDQPKCIGCFLCEKICPWDAITMVPPLEAPVI